MEESEKEKEREIPKHAVNHVEQFGSVFLVKVQDDFTVRLCENLVRL